MIDLLFVTLTVPSASVSDKTSVIPSLWLFSYAVFSWLKIKPLSAIFFAVSAEIILSFIIFFSVCLLCTDCKEKRATLIAASVFIEHFNISSDDGLMCVVSSLRILTSASELWASYVESANKCSARLVWRYDFNPGIFARNNGRVSTNPITFCCNVPERLYLSTEFSKRGTSNCLELWPYKTNWVTGISSNQNIKFWNACCGVNESTLFLLWYIILSTTVIPVISEAPLLILMEGNI